MRGLEVENNDVGKVLAVLVLSSNKSHLSLTLSAWNSSRNSSGGKLSLATSGSLDITTTSFQ